ncbi:TonB-dependent receptor [Leptobacterium sp. I13]|uniref:TonB-dependent receptor n=1 Tax=Leptobacterium meishanense TaxID=3128904 RepID=UPI0030EE8762
MNKRILLFFTIALSFSATSQKMQLKGIIIDTQTKNPIKNGTATIEELGISETTNKEGTFLFSDIPVDSYIINIKAFGYITQRLPVSSTSEIALDVGAIYLEKDLSQEKTDNLITLTENDLFDDSEIDNPVGILQATRDVFLSRAAFDFGQAFFKPRGYDSRDGAVLINGIPMNKFFNGRPQWNNWGGLNDIIRNQEFTYGLAPSSVTFGGIAGTTNINIRASLYRPGLRLSSSASNRTYRGRVMATYHSGLQKSNFAYSVSASRRWTEEGYIAGTLYDAYSVFATVEYLPAKNHSLNLTALLASNRRGRSAPLTEEVFDLVGNTYNPYWGIQNGDIRNSRVRTIQEPIVMFNYLYDAQNFKLNAGIAYQFGKIGRTRLSYFNAPNPDPSYYRYLPSFYINSPGGANFENANLAKEGFLLNPQLNWQAVFQANSNEQLAGKSVYLLQEDRTDDTQLTANAVANIKLNQKLTWDVGVTYRTLTSENYALIKDLLGSTFHEDTDPFSDTRNDVNNDLIKEENDRFNYDYSITTSEFQGFSQLQFNHKKWEAFLAGTISQTSYQREGNFLNERFQENSLGKSETLQFSNYGIKAGLAYKITGRHMVSINAGYLTKAPILQNAFINPRENNEVVPEIKNETIQTADITYLLRLPEIKARATAYYTRFENVTDINFFFVESGVGTDFVQEVVSGISKQHIGGEIGIEYQASPTVKLTGVAAIGEFTYADNAHVTINFDTAGREEDIINPEGNLDLGSTNIKGLKLPNGPQKAYSLGIEYRDPDYWWVGMTANQLSDRYIDISTITRTASFAINPDDPNGARFPGATDEAIAQLLKQRPLEDIHLLNVVGGKSWLVNDMYISVFASINNVFDTIFRTGGFEQSRNGNFGQLTADVSRSNPSFGPKYWYGFGRTYFINLAISF